MNTRGYKLEHALYALAFLFALFMRIILLGRLPLSDSEAYLALQALSLSEGGRVNFGTQPAYILFTSVLFNIFNDTNFSARLLPAVIGSLVVFIPFGLRDKLGRTAALLAAFGLAFDPGLLALSRTADSRILAVVFGMYAVISFIARKPAMMGLYAALTVLSGPAAWNFIFVLVLGSAWLILNQIGAGQGKDGRKISITRVWQSDDMPFNYGNLLIWFGGVLVLGGTLFFTKPVGIVFAFNGLIEYLGGWASSSQISLTAFLIALMVYELLPVVFGIWGGIRGWVMSDAVDQILTRWLGVALLVILLYPSHQIADLGLVNLILWLLAGRHIHRYPFNFDKESIPAWGQTVMTVVLLGFAAYHILGVANAIAGNTDRAALEWVGVVGAFLFILVIFAGVAWGWGYQLGLRGFSWAVLIMLAGFTFSSAWNAGGLGRNPGAELWRTSPLIKDADILLNTVESASISSTGFSMQAEMRLVDVDSDALRWLLRNFPNHQFVRALPNSQTPAIVITNYQDQLALGAEYSGQDFSWQQMMNWQNIYPQDWIRWIMLRKIPENYNRIMVWVRSDLFPGETKE